MDADTLKVIVLQKTPGSIARLRGGLGAIVSIAIAAVAIYALTHALRKSTMAKYSRLFDAPTPGLSGWPCCWSQLHTAV